MYCIDENLYKRIIGVKDMSRELQIKCQSCGLTLVDSIGRVRHEGYKVKIKHMLGVKDLTMCKGCASMYTETCEVNKTISKK